MHREFFSQESRLLVKGQFDKVFSNSRRIVYDIYALLYCPNNLNYPRLGLIVAKKNISDATRRNRFKRIVRESFRKRAFELAANDIVIIAYKKADITTNEEIRKCLTKCWDKLVA